MKTSCNIMIRYFLLQSLFLLRSSLPLFPNYLFFASSFTPILHKKKITHCNSQPEETKLFFHFATAVIKSILNEVEHLLCICSIM